MIEMKDRGPPITETDIERVENKLGVRFPDDYREFLLRVNGGHPARGNVEFQIRTGGSLLSVLYGIHKKGDPNDLEDEIHTGWSDILYIPETLIPIGHDVFSNIICLGVAGNERGKVYFRDSERVPGEPPTKEWTKMKGIYRIADSFSEFLASLTPREDI